MNKTDDCKKFESLTAQVEADRIECLETVAAKLRERVKELTCLYGISQIISDPDKSFAQKIMHILLLLPPAWQYAARACARIIIDGENYQTPDFQCGKHQQIARICAMDQDRGVVEIHYAEAGFPEKKSVS